VSVSLRKLETSSDLLRTSFGAVQKEASALAAAVRGCRRSIALSGVLRAKVSVYLSVYPSVYLLA
jgi:hypothetical protein